MVLVESRTAMTPTGWTAFAVTLFLALPLSRQVVGQPGQSQRTDLIVLLGHSHVQNWKIDSLAGFRTINRGRGGDHTQDLLNRFDRDVVANRPRAVVIWAFDNDVMDVPNSDKAAATQRAEANLLKLVDMAKAHSIEPIVTTEVTVLPISVSDQITDAFLWFLGKKSYDELVNTRILEWNKWIREQADRRRILLLDVQRVLADSSERRRPQYAVRDGVHLTKAAYDAITAEAEVKLRASLRR
jgi:lysophospholipase L1-like esterase